MLVNIFINGSALSASPSQTIIQALWQAGNPRLTSVGCLDGVCGSCLILVCRGNNVETTQTLACQTLVEDNMQIIFPLLQKTSRQRYDLSKLKKSNEIQPYFQHIFPEASQCRACGGCTQSCPKGIDVEQGVKTAAKGAFEKAGELFVECIMCDACVSACPEFIDPNYVGLFSRRVTALFHPRPANLMNRLEQLQQRDLTIIEPEKA